MWVRQCGKWQHSDVIDIQLFSMALWHTSEICDIHNNKNILGSCSVSVTFEKKLQFVELAAWVWSFKMKQRAGWNLPVCSQLGFPKNKNIYWSVFYNPKAVSQSLSSFPSLPFERVTLEAFLLRSKGDNARTKIFSQFQSSGIFLFCKTYWVAVLTNAVSLLIIKLGAEINICAKHVNLTKHILDFIQIILGKRPSILKYVVKLIHLHIF